MSKSKIPIDHIVTDRELRPGDELSDLIASLSEVGMKHPILVDENMNLIDGLRRLEAWRVFGETEVTVLVAKTLEETCTALAKVRKHAVASRPVTPLRLWEIFNVVQPQMKERGTRLRARRTGIPRSQPVEEAVRSRTLLCESMGFPGEAMLAASTTLYKAFTTTTDPDRRKGLDEIRARMEQGELSLYEARGAMERLGKSDMSGDIVNADQQRDAFSTALNQLTGVAKVVTRIGEPNAAISTAELEMYLKDFELGRRDLQRFITSLRKRVTKQ